MVSRKISLTSSDLKTPAATKVYLDEDDVEGICVDRPTTQVEMFDEGIMEKLDYLQSARENVHSNEITPRSSEQVPVAKNYHPSPMKPPSLYVKHQF